MAIDMTQFLQTFYEESFEGLEIMEAELLNLDGGDASEDTINTIFRAAHSIKGGAGTFGLQEIAAFTHVMETLLDEVRDGKRDLCTDLINLLLRSADCVKAMMAASRDEEEYDVDEVESVQKSLRALIDNKTDTTAPTTPDADPAKGKVESSEVSYKISFIPLPNLLQTGNDPARLFNELDELGKLTIDVDHDAMPELVDLPVDECTLSWTLTLVTTEQPEVIRAVFDWVSDECELTISCDENEQPEPEQENATVESKEPSTTKVEPKPKEKSDKVKEQGSIRVGIDKVDSLINLVGELVITQSMLGQLGKDFAVERLEKLKDGLSQLERNTRELQENVMSIRMLPISFAFNRFPRLVHDLNQQLGKKIELKMTGEHTELDKTVLEKIVDPLVHLVRNSVDHGIETPAVRLKQGKPEIGTVELKAYHKGGSIIIEIRDDGAGLDTDRIHAKAVERGLIGSDEVLSEEQVYDLIFRPGFSTTEVVSDVSGRGVGMDVVKRNIRALSGVVDVKSVKNKGTIFTIRLPLTLAIMDGQLIQIGGHTYIIPLISIIESLQIKKELVNTITARASVYKLREDYIEIVPLYKIFGIEAMQTEIINGLLVVVEGDGKKVGLLVDDLLDQQQVVIKSLETNYKKVEGISGATILGDGTVAMILDIQGLIELAHRYEKIDDIKNNVSEVA